MLSRKETSWKKSRKFGDTMGGRSRPKLADNIFNRAHSLNKPSEGEETPIYLAENSSRDFFFPVTIDEIKNELQSIPSECWEFVTHIWLRRFKNLDRIKGEIPLAEIAIGSGVHLITIYPFPLNFEWNHGKLKPKASIVRMLDRYKAKLTYSRNEYISKWDISALKDFYIEYLLFNRIGYHLDWFARYWSKANRRIVDEAAEQYAYYLSSKREFTFLAEQKSTPNH